MGFLLQPLVTLPRAEVEPTSASAAVYDFLELMRGAMMLTGLTSPRDTHFCFRCNNPMEIDLVILVAKGEALHDQSSVQEIDDLSKQKRHVKSGEVLRHAGSTNFV
ncbi:hypothetical protein J6590_007769 [Homalodisca vitripennis]|nr:hypothetical protein J6590_007769 [Homalodisca vitripennis]